MYEIPIIIEVILNNAVKDCWNPLALLYTSCKKGRLNDDILTCLGMSKHVSSGV